MPQVVACGKGDRERAGDRDGAGKNEGGPCKRNGLRDPPDGTIGLD
jgi:hypothetical protein